MESVMSLPGADYAAITPHLDAALASLRPVERSAVVLRYFQERPFGEIGERLHLSEAATKKRIERAVHKLRRFFARQNITLSVSSLPLALAWHAQLAVTVPAALAGKISAAAFSIKGAAVSAGSLSLVRGALRTMFWTKLKIAAICSITLTLFIVTTLAAQHSASSPPASLPSTAPYFTGHVSGATLELVAVGGGIGADSSAWQADGSRWTGDDLVWKRWNGDRQTVRHILLQFDATDPIVPALKITEFNASGISWSPADTGDIFQWELMLDATAGEAAR